MSQLATDLPQLTKVNHVKSVFENVSHYIGGRYVDIRMRADTVRVFANKSHWRRLLDIGCGDGSISLPLLAADKQLVLLDLSSNMAATAAARVPSEFSANVEVRNEDFVTAKFGPEAFDLIICVGVVAHVDSPEQFIARITKLLRPGGSLIVEFTDSRHPIGRLGRALGWLKELAAPAKYRTNYISSAQMQHIFNTQRLQLVSVFRYANIPIPLIERVLKPEVLLAIVRRVFGRNGRNRTAWLGNEYLCLLTSPEA